MEQKAMDGAVPVRKKSSKPHRQGHKVGRTDAPTTLADGERRKKSRSRTSADRMPLAMDQAGSSGSGAGGGEKESSGLAKAIGKLLSRGKKSDVGQQLTSEQVAEIATVEKVRTVHAHKYTEEPNIAWEMLRDRRPVKPVRPMPLETPVRPDAVRFVCLSCTHSGALGFSTVAAGGADASDTGGRAGDDRPIMNLPLGDVLVVAGDFTSMGLPEEVRTFDQALGYLPHAVKVVVAGHKELSLDESFVGHKTSGASAGSKDQAGVRQAIAASLGAQRLTTARSFFNNAIYLQDDCFEAFGLMIYGAPWLPPSGSGGAFGLSRGKELLDKWNLIPTGVDVLVTHGPPLGHGDVNRDGMHVGDVELLNTICKRVRPKYHVYGHIHHGYGCTTDGYTKYINCSLCDSHGRLRNRPVIFDVPVESAHKDAAYGRMQNRHRRDRKQTY